MKTSKFTETQIVSILKQATAGYRSRMSVAKPVSAADLLQVEEQVRRA